MGFLSWAAKDPMDGSFTAKSIPDNVNKTGYCVQFQKVSGVLVCNTMKRAGTAVSFVCETCDELSLA